MFQIDLKSRKSIYEQIIDGFKELILSGILKADDKIPSIRDLSAQLTVNPNTIQKAYRVLEQQGWIYSSPGLGSFVAAREGAGPDEKKVSEIMVQMKSLIKELGYQGLSKEEIINRITQIAETTEVNGKGGVDHD